MEQQIGKLQHSPVRRSPRLQSDAEVVPLTSTEPMQRALDKECTETQKKQPAKSTPKQPAESSKASASHSNSAMEMQKEIDMLKRKLAETNAKLSSSERQCQQMQSALQEEALPSTSNCPGLPSASETQSESSLSGHAASTTYTPHARVLDAPTGILPETRYTNTNAIAANSNLPLATTNSAMNVSLPEPAQIFSAPLMHAATAASSFNTSTFSSSNVVMPPFCLPHSSQPNVMNASLPQPAQICSAPPTHAATAASSSNTCTLPPSDAAISPFCFPHSSQPNVMNISLPQPAQTCSAPPMHTVTAASSSNTCILPPSNAAISPFYFPHSSQPNAMNPRKLQELPEFSGEPEDWPAFYTAFSQSTAAYAYTNLENHQRLLKCLKGDARETVKSLLIHPDNIIAVIEQLRFRYGRPEQLIQSQLRQVREITYVSEQHLAKIIPFATKVKNLCTFLQSINGQHHIANPTLLEELVSKLPMSKKLEWARIAMNIQPYPTIAHFSDFLSETANLICCVQDSDHKEQKRRVLLNSVENSDECLFCQGKHKIPDCSRFLSLAVQERWIQIKKLQACFSCLGRGHNSRTCRRKKACQQNGCRRHHHKLLHENINVNKPPTECPLATTEVHQNVLSCLSPHYKKLLFRILPVTLYGENCRMDVYALFDEGSSVTMLDRTVAEKLGVRGRMNTLNIQWIGGRSAQENSTVLNVKIKGLGKSKCHILRDVYAVSNLNLPLQSLSENDIQAAFKSYNAPVKPYSDIMPLLLIGLDHAHLGLPMNVEKPAASGPIACNTKLGWVVYGPCRSVSTSAASCLFVSIQSDDSLHQLVDRLFNIESIGARAAPEVESHDDVRAKKILTETTKRIGERFETGLLWKSDKVSLPNSFQMALSRLDGIERKLMRDESFAKAYKDVIESYIKKGYARKVSPSEAAMPSERKWYLPHFGVTNPNKAKKVRLVFDAVARVEGISLNSHLLKGPQDIELLPSILFNFRRGNVAVCADIREMYHQVLIRHEDRVSQRFLWRDCDRNKQPEEYEMIAMTFGAACSPCSARHVIKVNAYDHSQRNSSRAIEAIIKHHYIDDFVDSFDSEEEALHVSREVRDIHKDGGFELRSFVSNSARVRTALDGCELPKDMLAEEGYEKVLGIYWESSSDTLRFKIKFNKVNSAVISGQRKPTKRELLSIIMSTFDPLGLLSMFTIGGKLILREVWRRDCRWDEEVPDELADAWLQWRTQMDRIADFHVTRCYFSNREPMNIQLHIFVDASEDAFASVAYWRYASAEGDIHVSFIASRTRCAPMKLISVPRLELQAAVLGTRLKQSVLEGHSFTPEKCYLWSDSKTVLKWIDSKHRRYKPYVAHRIAEILATTEIEEWKWLPTNENVADEATRFSKNIDFSPTSRWILGPAFLKSEESEWPKDLLPETVSDEEETRQKTCLLVSNNEFINFDRFSSFLRMKRVVAWVLRFVNRCKKLYDPLGEHGLTASEIDAAEIRLALIAQSEAFAAEICRLKNSECLPRGSQLTQLSPYIAEYGLLRINGRIEAASFLPYCSKRPIILPYDHKLTNLILQSYHCQQKHINHEATICEIRKKFWVLKIRRLLQRVVSRCLVCKIKKATPRTPLMGPLPKDRMEPYTRPFKNTGLDYFGPVTVSIGRRTEKRWVALFTCLTVRAIHLEIAHDLSTDSCIIAIKNFMNRRGVPARIRSDNGKNFVGASQEAKRFSEVFESNRIQEELSSKGVEWIFNCPMNPSEGGAWERMVQCVKKVLRHTMKDISPKEHVFQALLVEAENIVNSRPLTHLPVGVHEESPLTPNHFLIGHANVAQTPEIDDVEKKLCTLRKQWRVVKSLRDRLWKRWVLEYLPTLTRRVKWCEMTRPIKEQDLVFVCDPQLPRNQWRRGIVSKVYSGADGVARRVDVKTSSGFLRRAVSRVAVLDVDDGEAGRFTKGGV